MALMILPTLLIAISHLTSLNGPPAWSFALIARGRYVYPGVMALWWSGVGLLCALYIWRRYYPSAGVARIALLTPPAILLLAAFGVWTASDGLHMSTPHIEGFRWDSRHETYTLRVSLHERLVDPEVSDRLRLVVLVEEIEWVRSQRLVAETTGPRTFPLSSLPIRVVDTWSSIAKLEPIEFRPERPPGAGPPRSIPQVRIWLESWEGNRVSNEVVYHPW